MLQVGDRVALNRTVLTTDNQPARENEVGIVIGHRGQTPIVSLDHRGSDEKLRVVEWEASAFRKVVVAHPGEPRRSKPRRQQWTR